MRVVGNIEHDQFDETTGIQKCTKSQREPPVLPCHARPNNCATDLSRYGEKHYECCPQLCGWIVEQIQPRPQARERKKQRQQDKRKDGFKAAPERLLPR